MLMIGFVPQPICWFNAVVLQLQISHAQCYVTLLLALAAG